MFVNSVHAIIVSLEQEWLDKVCYHDNIIYNCSCLFGQQHLDIMQYYRSNPMRRCSPSLLGKIGEDIIMQQTARNA